MNTRYYRMDEVNDNAQVNETPDCLYVDLPYDNVWDLYEKLNYHLRHNRNQPYMLVFPCKLTECNRWGQELGQKANEEISKKKLELSRAMPYGTADQLEWVELNLKIPHSWLVNLMFLSISESAYAMTFPWNEIWQRHYQECNDLMTIIWKCLGWLEWDWQAFAELNDTEKKNIFYYIGGVKKRICNKLFAEHWKWG
jgi:hypothetical protein